jgi:hypothetical protein
MDSEVRSVRDGLHPSDATGMECCLLVFPVYHATLGQSGIPGPVSRLVERQLDAQPTNVYALVTHDGFPGSTLHNLDRMLRRAGGRLSAGFAIRAGVSFTAGANIRHALGLGTLTYDEEQDTNRGDQLRDEWRTRLPGIAALIAAGRAGPVEGATPLTASLMRPWLALQRQTTIARAAARARGSVRSRTSRSRITGSLVEYNKRWRWPDVAAQDLYATAR